MPAVFYPRALICITIAVLHSALPMSLIVIELSCATIGAVLCLWVTKADMHVDEICESGLIAWTHGTEAIQFRRVLLSLACCHFM